MKQPRIIGIGIATMDIYCHQNRMYPGGNEYNVAYDAKLLGADAGFMGVFANDKVGEILEQTLADVGIDTSHSHHKTGSSGYALVDLREGDRVFLDWNRQGVTDVYPFTFTEKEIKYIKTFDIASLSWGSRLTVQKIRKLADAGVSISYDFYDNFTKDIVSGISPYVKLGFFSCSHLTEEETKAVLKNCVDLGAELAVGTRGGEPAIAYNGKDYIAQKICKVQAKDTMGAGDSFISSFLTNYLSVEADTSVSAEDKITAVLQKAAEFAATVVVKDGSLGVGYDVNPDRLSDIINI